MSIQPLEDRTVGRILATRAARYGSKPFLLFQDQRLSYADMNEQAQRVSRGLWDKGVRKGDKVGLLVGNRPEMLFAIYGILSIGAVEVPINTGYKGDLLAYIVDHSEARSLIIEAEYLHRLAEVADRLPGLQWVWIIGEVQDPPTLPWTLLPFNSLLNGPAEPPDVSVSPSDLAGIMYTSGTTGPSKGVLCTHHYFYSFAEEWQRNVGLMESDVYYTCLPYFHFNAQMACTLTAMVTGATVAMDTRFSASQFWHSIKRYGATGFNLLGAMCHILLKQPPGPQETDHTVRFCMAAPAPREVYEEFEGRFGLRLVEGYGSTEANMPLFMPLEDRRPGSCGKPRVQFDVQIVDEYDWPLPPGATGEIVVRPQMPWTMMSGYYRMPEKTVEAWRNGWFHTGDRGYKDTEGYFYFVDRMKDAIRRRGENISSYEIERVVNQHPNVLESAAIAVPSELSEEEVKVVVVLKEGMEVKPEEIVQFCQRRMAYFMVPRYVEFVAELPKTPSGKVEKHKLRALGITPHSWDREAAGFAIER